MTMGLQMTVASYAAVYEFQPAQLARLLSELEELTRRAREIIDPGAGLGFYLEKDIDGSSRLKMTQQALLDETVEFDFSKFAA
jgi:hypothetical protein